MEKNKIIFGFTLAFSIILEWFIRKGAVLLLGTNGFDMWPWIDNIMHFAWGFNIFLFLLLIMKWEPIDAILGVFAWQMVWESIEMIGDIVVEQPTWMLDHFFFDGIKDTIVDLLGALLAWRLFAWKKKDKHPKKFRAFMIKWLYAAIALSVIGSMPFAYYYILGLPFKSPDLLAVYWISISGMAIAFYEVILKKMK